MMKMRPSSPTTTLACLLGAALLACSPVATNGPGKDAGSSGGGGGTVASGGSGGSQSSGGSGGASNGGSGGTASGGSGGTVGSGGSGGGSGGSGGGSGSPDAGGAPTGGALTIMIDHVPGPNGTLCFKPESTNSGGNHSPKIDWTGVPSDAKSLVLTMEDQNPPATPHQIVCNLMPTETGRPADAKGVIPAGAQQGFGHGGKTGWYGPGAGLRNYEITIWALATPMLEGGCTNAKAAMAKLKAAKADKTLVLASSALTLRGQANGTGCP